MKQRVCLFTDSLEPSGVGEHMLALAAELRDAFQIYFVCPPTSPGLRVLERAANLGLDTVALTVRGGGDQWEQLREWLRERQIQIFHAHAGIAWEAQAGIYAARIAGVPIVVRTEHLPYVIHAEPQRCLDHSRMLRAVDQVICVSQEASATFLRGGIPSEKLRVVRNGISPRHVRSDALALRESLDLEPHTRLVLTVARMTDQKGHRDLLRAVPAVLAGEPNACFLWVGQGPLELELRERVHDLGLEARVMFLGHRSDVPELLAASDLFVLPSLFEGLPLVVLEAMAAGLPVVGTRVCGMTEAISDGITGLLVEAGDARALAEAMLAVLAQPGLSAQLGEAGRQRVDRDFGVARMARETAVIYDELLSQRQPGRVAS